MLSDRQKFGLMLGLAAICAIAVFPPWRQFGVQEIPLGYAPIFAPPIATMAGAGRIDLDTSRLTLEIIVASIVTFGLLVVGGGGGGGSARGVQGAAPGGFMARLAEAREAMLAAQQLQMQQAQARQTAQKATAPAAAAAAAAGAMGKVESAPVDSRFTRVELPANYYIGEFLVESDDDADYWEALAPAKGTIDLPKGKKIQLELAKDIRVDLTVLSAIPAGVLYSIDASECKLTDDDVTKLTAISGLKELDLAGTPITSSSVSNLRGLSRLERLWLDRTLINDECVPALGSLSKLKKLSLTETKLNDLALESLRKDLADCEVVS
ncbi:MAG: hypothetical protein KGS72_02605 [Cyanobacteria bacterium REEB67]|nr:hypothetical protein [Cyanobacteria bacterium REEB67]